MILNFCLFHFAAGNPYFRIVRQHNRHSHSNTKQEIEPTRAGKHVPLLVHDGHHKLAFFSEQLIFCRLFDRILAAQRAKSTNTR